MYIEIQLIIGISSQGFVLLELGGEHKPINVNKVNAVRPQFYLEFVLSQRGISATSSVHLALVHQKCALISKL